MKTKRTELPALGVTREPEVYDQEGNSLTPTSVPKIDLPERGPSSTARHGALVPQNCPRFEKCAAPLCPLDAEWRRRKHLQGERLCYFLREAVKKGAAARFEATANGEILAAAARMLAEPENLGAYVRQKLRDAAQTASRLDSVKHLQPRRRGTSSQQDERSQVDYQGVSGGCDE